MLFCRVRVWFYGRGVCRPCRMAVDNTYGRNGKTVTHDAKCSSSFLNTDAGQLGHDGEGGGVWGSSCESGRKSGEDVAKCDVDEKGCCLVGVDDRVGE